MPAGNAGVDPVVPEPDAPVTARVLESGGVVLGSTVMPDWGMLSSGVSSRHGITRSPWNPAWTTGGSSSGAGAAAAGGYGPLHVGTDIGGSIRLPAPGWGWPRSSPATDGSRSTTPYLGRVAGPMTRTVADAALLMQVISRPDARDWTSLPPRGPRLVGARRAPVTGLRVGVHLDAGCGAPVDAATSPRSYARAAACFEEAGAVVEELDAVHGPGAARRPGPVLAGAVVERLPAACRSRRSSGSSPTSPSGVHGGADVPGARVLECYHQIMRIQARTVAATAPYDLVLSPVAPVAGVPRRAADAVHGARKTMSHIGFTAPYNMSGQPAATVNCGFTDDGRPIGRADRRAAGSTTSACCARRSGTNRTDRPRRCPAGPTPAHSGDRETT